MRQRFVNIDADRPYTRAGYISRLFNGWIHDLLWKGLKRPLTFSDLYGLPEQDKVGPIADRLENGWRKSASQGTMGYCLVLAKVFGARYFVYTLIHLFTDLTLVVAPILFQRLSDHLTLPSNSSDHTTVWLLAACFAFTIAIQAFVSHWNTYLHAQVGIQIRGATMALLYRKILRLNSASLSETTVGQVISLASNDIHHLFELAQLTSSMANAPILAVIILWYAYKQVGVVILGGLFILIIAIIIQMYTGTKTATYKLRETEATDERVKLTNDVILGIRAIKLNCWEDTFQEIIEKSRNNETHQMWMDRSYGVVATEMIFIDTRLVTMVILVGSYLLGNAVPLTAAFTILALLYHFVHVVVDRIVWGVKHLMEINVHIGRITRVLLLTEADVVENKSQADAPATTETMPSIALQKITATWGTNGHFELQNIALDVRKGQLLALIGPVGAGKSSLLQCILGEMQTTSGHAMINGRIGYVSQQAWIFSDTLRENVIFGRDFDERKYKNVIYITALDKDIQALTNGDQTVVGERGVMLSGGQKARVSLARALYSDADVYLLDDPLSAVDAAVGKHIFEKCILEALHEKIRILVTHQLQYLPQVDRIVILEQGKITAHGTYTELCESQIRFMNILEQSQTQLEKQNPKGTPQSTDELSGEMFETELSEEVEISSHEDDTTSSYAGLSNLWIYLRSGLSLKRIIFLIAINIAVQTVYSLSDWTLAVWVRNEFQPVPTSSPHLAYSCNNYGSSSTHTDLCTQPSMVNNSEHCHRASMTCHGEFTQKSWNNYATIISYIALSALIYALGVTRGRVFWRSILECSTTLHNRMIHSLLHAPVKMFDSSTVGKILNPFSAGLTDLDVDIPNQLDTFAKNFLMVLGSLLTILWVNPWLVLIILPLAALQYMIYYVYTTTGHHTERMHSNSQAPMYSYLSTTLQGLSDIRAFGAQEYCQENFESCINHYHGADLNSFWVYNWYNLYTGIVQATFINLTVFSGLLSTSEESRSYAGLCMMLSLQLLYHLQDFMTSILDTKTQMGSIVRVFQMANVQSEGQYLSQRPLPEKWPQHGDITLKNLSLQYSTDGPYVLKNITARIEAKEKIGIVGRTGAGKSSLVHALLRLSAPTGHVFIDGVNVMEIGLQDLRQKVSVIPQDPVLYSGTLRRNLDPPGQCSNEDMWSALEQVEMAEYFRSQPDGLDSSVSEGGANLNVGQRQLVCLARAILRRCRILILDEATANVDMETDVLIQRCLREQFTDCTVLAIAHRLHTVTYANRIMVLEDGELLQFDTPYALVHDDAGAFAKLLDQTGPAEKKRLIHMITNCSKTWK